VSLNKTKEKLLVIVPNGDHEHELYVKIGHYQTSNSNCSDKVGATARMLS